MAGGVAGDMPPPPPAKRPFCLRCTKAARLCLCSRLPSPPLDNSVAVTVIQHRREASHPLNSARVAALGLKNVAVFPVSDVNFCAQFVVAPLVSSEGFLEANSSSCMESRSQEEKLILDFEPENSIKAGEKCYIRYGPNHLRLSIERGSKPDLSSILASPIGKAILKHGFSVKKLQRKQLPVTLEFKDFEEFNIVVPCGSILLFPGKKSIVAGEVDFEVKHVFVLDGTWAKARRMCYENPWLQFLPCLRLVTEQKSLYREVRHQPQDGCLSTVESIICAMKDLGFDIDGLDNLLDVFASMIGDQRRCKDEKFSRKSDS